MLSAKMALKRQSTESYTVLLLITSFVVFLAADMTEYRPFRILSYRQGTNCSSLKAYSEGEDLHFDTVYGVVAIGKNVFEVLGGLSITSVTVTAVLVGVVTLGLAHLRSMRNVLLATHTCYMSS